MAYVLRNMGYHVTRFAAVVGIVNICVATFASLSRTVVPEVTAAVTSLNASRITWATLQDYVIDWRYDWPACPYDAIVVIGVTE